MLNNISLEELIALKLESSSKLIKNKRYFCFPIYRTLDHIVKDAIIKFALSSTRSILDASMFLGITNRTLFKVIKQYNIDQYFNEDKFRYNY